MSRALGRTFTKRRSFFEPPIATAMRRGHLRSFSIRLPSLRSPVIQPSPTTHRIFQRRFARAATPEEEGRTLFGYLARYAAYGFLLYSPFLVYDFISKPVKWPPKDLARMEQPNLSAFFTQLPSRSLSRLFGRLMETDIQSKGIRKLVYETYGLIYGVQFDEYEHDLTTFPNMQEFFTRKLKYPRYVAQADLVSPVDGTFLVGGQLDEEYGEIQQIKDMKFKVEKFLGHMPEKVNESNNLYYAVLYLSPGDYHRFHAPCDANIEKVRHFPGDLFPVQPWILRIVPGLFSLNERVVLSGKWGRENDLYFAYVPVGAYNCGTIQLDFDTDLLTNAHYQDECARSYGRRIPHQSVAYYEDFDNEIPLPYGRSFEFAYEEPIMLQKGEEIGMFKLGSTVVMVWEAPSFKFRPRTGDKIRFGQKLGDCCS